jgi:transaldolase
VTRWATWPQWGWRWGWMISRELLAGGGLQSLVDGRHDAGVITNPDDLAAALSRGDRYDEQLADLASRGADVDATVLVTTTSA